MLREKVHAAEGSPSAPPPVPAPARRDCWGGSSVTPLRVPALCLFPSSRSDHEGAGNARCACPPSTPAGLGQ